MILDKPITNERRQSPRHEMNLPVDIVQESGNILSASTRNISSNGLQVVCDTWVTNEIEPRGIQSHSVNHLRFKIVAQLPVEDKTLKLYASCRVVSVHRLSQDEYILSMVFLNFENGTEGALERFINQYKHINVIHKGVIGE